MRLAHPDHPGRSVRLAYGLNLHPAEDLDGCLAGMERITLPLRERLFDVAAGRAAGEGFGVAPWLPYTVAVELGVDDERLERYTGFLVEHGLDAFTYNAFPFGGFHRPGLKEGVFRPTWKAAERTAYTLAVARVAAEGRVRFLREWGSDVVRPQGDAHLSISTHCGGFGPDVAGRADQDEIAEAFAQCAVHLAEVEDRTGLRVVLSLEPEPRSSANDTGELSGLHERIRMRSEEVIGRGYPELRELSVAICGRHLGTCLDACHAAVEFEAPDEALTRATTAGTPLGKLQFSSALALPEPAARHAGRERLLAMAEPVYLHQVTARGRTGLARVLDLPEAAAAWEAGDPAWREADEWRCHFHVPVDLGEVGAAAGLGTTRAQADRLLDAVLAAPGRWGTEELHVEIETYTWDVLPDDARGPGELVDGLEREYRHVLARLASAGWIPVVGPP